MSSLPGISLFPDEAARGCQAAIALHLCSYVTRIRLSKLDDILPKRHGFTGKEKRVDYSVVRVGS